MNGNDIAYDIWYALGDKNKEILSPPHMLVLINEALALVTEAVNGSASNYLVKEATITMTDGAGELPDDFHNLVGVWAGTSRSSQYVLEEMSAPFPVDRYTFRIMGESIYSTNDNLFLCYKSRIEPLTKLEAEIELPEVLRRHLKNLVLRLLAPIGNGESNTETYIQAELALIARKLTRRDRRGRVSRLSFTLEE